MESSGPGKSKPGTPVGPLYRRGTAPPTGGAAYPYPPGFLPPQNPKGYHVETPLQRPEDGLRPPQGFPTNRHAWYQDFQPGSPATNTRLAAMQGRLQSAVAYAAGVPVGKDSPCQTIDEDPEFFFWAQLIAKGLRSGLGGNPKPWMAFDPSGVMPPVAAMPINVNANIMVQVPGIPDVEQTDTILNMIQANGGLYLQCFPVPALSLAPNPNDLYLAPRVINGRGEVIGYNFGPASIVIIDRIWCRTWTMIGGEELIIALGVGLKEADNVIGPFAQPPAFTQLMMSPTSAASLGDAQNPYVLTGRRSAPDGSLSNRVERVSMSVVHQGVNLPLLVKSAPHYAEVGFRGWELNIGQDGCPIAQSVGGNACTGETCY